jgi:hypothetical protein
MKARIARILTGAALLTVTAGHLAASAAVRYGVRYN